MISPLNERAPWTRATFPVAIISKAKGRRQVVIRQQLLLKGNTQATTSRLPDVHIQPVKVLRHPGEIHASIHASILEDHQLERLAQDMHLSRDIHDRIQVVNNLLLPTTTSTDRNRWSLPHVRSCTILRQALIRDLRPMPFDKRNIRSNSPPEPLRKEGLFPSGMMIDLCL
jgi:hypothetical protein